jgi:hypothetical protein
MFYGCTDKQVIFVLEMTCEYIPDPRGKRHIWHEPKVIKQAMFPIQKGNSIRSVSKTTGIPYSVLQCYYKKYKTNNNVVVNKIGGQTTLPVSMELTLVANIIKMC